MLLLPNAVVEDETMSGTVHGLESELLFLHLEPEHVLGVHIPMTRGLPQARVVNVGRNNLDKRGRKYMKKLQLVFDTSAHFFKHFKVVDYLLKSSLPVLFSNELN